MNGFFNLYKPSGMTSALLVHLVKKKTGAKCGHMGTLDPMASGVLPVGIGKANRLFEYLLDKEKEYAAEFTFGAETDTLDKTGAVTQTSEYLPAREELEALLPRFVGESGQVPPRYSAKNVGGRRGYDLARRGVEFTLPPKKVTVTSYRLTGQPGRGVFSFLIRCKGGTYIRSLARDLGRAAGSFAYMSALERTEAGCFRRENAVSVDEFMNLKDVFSALTPADEAVSFPQLRLSGREAEKLLNGVPLAASCGEGLYRAYGDGFLGIAEVRAGQMKLRTYVRE